MVEDRSTLLIADSFRVRRNPQTGAAEVRGLQRHLERFKWATHRAWCGEHVPSPEEVRRRAETEREMRARHPLTPNASLLVCLEIEWTAEEQHTLDKIDVFLAEALSRIAAYGEGWPRLELWRDSDGEPPRLALQLRPLPELATTIELRTAGRIKTVNPELKGPNIARYAELNRELGAEALLLDARGMVLEGATTSFIWWPRHPDSPEACGSVSSSSHRVRSVTEMLILNAAERRLVGTKPNRTRIGQPQPRAVTVEQLAQHEVWAVNALHGIRPVTAIDDVPLPAPHERRLKWFHEALDRTWEPVVPGKPEERGKSI